MKGLTRAVFSLLSLASWASCESNLTSPLSSRVILPNAFKPAAVFKNVNLLRNINLEKGYVRETINVVIENIDSKPQQEYFLPFTHETVDRIGGLEVRDKKDPGRTGFEIALVEYDPYSTTQFYRIRLPETLKPAGQQTLSISFFILSSLKPLPATIEQIEKQYLVYTFSAYAPSAYETVKQKTKLKLPNPDVPEYTRLPSNSGSGKEDPQREGSSFTYGPYSNIPAGASELVKVRYEFTRPINHARLLERDLEISHWGGNLATEERYWLENQGAHLSKHFSRADWVKVQHFNPPTAALKELRFPLKGGASDPYFTDDIGNVSTSRFRSNIREANLELKPRYPVFGGWKYSFRVGWNADLSGYLRKVPSTSSTTGGDDQTQVSKGNTYVLKVPLLEGPLQPEGIEYEKVHLRIILPEGSKNVRYEPPPGISLTAAEVGLHKTFMDTVGRTCLKLEAVNLVDELRERNIYVTYDYPPLAALRKPLTIFVGIYAVFIAAWAIGKLDTSIGRREK
ncbi:MAG: hypothetical protein M1823_002365 [Watsoniomyces obsoletus]|nr:MAG: hypothetical protein M1823_002365 [Watsoniomyces obsoletus]